MSIYNQSRIFSLNKSSETFISIRQTLFWPTYCNLQENQATIELSSAPFACIHF